MLSGFLQQKFGPLKLLMFSCVPYTLAWITAALATDPHTLYLSRLALTAGILSSNRRRRLI